MFCFCHKVFALTVPIQYIQWINQLFRMSAQGLLKKSDLLKHMIAHRGEKPHECTGCDKSISKY